jgi:hypothetical protein
MRTYRFRKSRIQTPKFDPADDQNQLEVGANHVSGSGSSLLSSLRNYIIEKKVQSSYGACLQICGEFKAQYPLKYKI